MSNTALRIVPNPTHAATLDVDNSDLEIPNLPTSSSSNEAVIFGLTSVSGGAGVTTIAVQMAYHLARRKASARIALISLDFENNALPRYLDVSPKTGIENFCQRPEVLDSEQCCKWLSQTQFGFDILAIPTSLSGNLRVNSETVIRFLDLLAGQYDYLILDIPRIWTPWTQASLGASNKLAMVCELNIPNLHLMRERCSALIQKIDQLAGIDIILNKFEKRNFGNSVKLSDAKKALLTMPVHTISAAQSKVREALNRGEPLAVAFEDIKIVKEIGLLTDRWISEAETRVSEQTYFT